MRLHCFCVHTRVCVHVCAVWCVRTVARMHVCENFCLSQISPKAPPASVCGLSVSLSHVHSCVSGCLVLAGVSFAWMCLGLPVMCVLQGSGPCDSTCLLPRCVTSDAHPCGLGKVDVWDPTLASLVYMCSLGVWLRPARVSDGQWWFSG